MKVTRKQVNNVFIQFVKSINGEVAQSYNDVDKYELDHNDQGYQIVQITNAQGGQHQPFGGCRYKPSQIIDLMQFSIKAIEVSKHGN